MQLYQSLSRILKVKKLKNFECSNLINNRYRIEKVLFSGPYELYSGYDLIDNKQVRIHREPSENIHAIENAKMNAAANGIDNVEFICADACDAAVLLKERGLKPDVVVVDPPRKGMYEDAINAVASMSPERIVYVSCDPATLARDILRFEGLGYKLKATAAVDMFPKTKHVESVALLIRK